MGIYYQPCGCYFCSVGGGFYHFCGPEHEEEFNKRHPKVEDEKYGCCIVEGCGAACYPGACEHQPRNPNMENGK